MSSQAPVPYVRFDKTPQKVAPPGQDKVDLRYSQESGSLVMVDAAGDESPLGGVSATGIATAIAGGTEQQKEDIRVALELDDGDGNIPVNGIILADSSDEVLPNATLSRDFRNRVVMHDNATPTGVPVTEDPLRFIGRHTFASTEIDSAAEAPSVTIATIPITIGEAAPGTIYELQGRVVMHHSGSVGCVASIGLAGAFGYSQVPNEGAFADFMFGYQKAATSLTAAVDFFMQLTNSAGSLASVASQPVPMIQTIRSTATTSVNLGTYLATGGGAMATAAQNLYLVLEALGETGATALSIAWDLTLRIRKP